MTLRMTVQVGVRGREVGERCREEGGRYGEE